MISFIAGRFAQSIVVMLTVGLIAFAMFRFVGDPINNMVGQDTSAAEREQIRENLGLNDPFYEQYIRFAWNAVQGEFGQSYFHRRPVSELLVERLPATLELSMIAAVLALALGVPAGVYTALHRRGILSNMIMSGSLLGVSIPTFLIGIILILIFGVIWRVLPTFGRGEVVDLGWWTTGFLTASGLKSLILPSVTLALFQLTLIMRLVRAEMLEVLRTDFIKFARARGILTRSIHFSHALKNSLVPVITITGLQLGSIIAFAIITETVFQWPGMGLLFIQAVLEVDIPVMAAYLVVIGFVFVFINFVVDILYFVVDPRLRADRAGSGH
ncbi:ABC transporter permease [Hwanghaeella sp.]|uniref:ABC transporter permease n=1 Tax=Hwanghaeella sp. TaxID=2605943 RepID=UPI003CCC0C27